MAKVKLSAVGLYTLCIELTEAGRRNYTVAGAPGGVYRDAAAEGEGEGDIGRPFAPAASLGCKMAPAWEVSNSRSPDLCFSTACRDLPAAFLG
jgi:hypothetical protein